MRMGQGVRTGLWHGGITCVLQTQFSSLFFFRNFLRDDQKVRVATVREKCLENEFFSRSGKSQGILWMAREI